MEQPESKTMTENNPSGKEQAKKPNPIRIVIMSILLALALIWGGSRLYHSFLYVETDNAQIDGDIYPVISRVPGSIADVLVKTNQVVNKGDVLIRLDPTDYEVRRNIAAAELLSAQAAVEASSNQANAAREGANAAEATSRKLQADLCRNENLRKQDVISQAEFDGFKAGAQAASAQYAAATNQYQAALAQVPLKKAEVKKREAELREAELQLSYTTITAPASGQVSKKNVLPGQYVAPGQQLIALVGSQELTVLANFKETQLDKIAPGLPVIIKVDAYPGKEFKGKVESLSSGTGAKFALLPPDNASGNFVKVTQRVPVKIIFTEKLDNRYPLAAGMNVVVEVKVK
ncbi:MAG: HlyD family secretion protein [Chlorobiaceae bacterium]